MRYLLHESDHPISTDYYYECRKTTNDHFPIIPAHTHDYYEIYIYLSGSVMLFIEGRIYKVKRGDIMVIPPYTIHQLLLTSEEQLNDEYDRTYMYITVFYGDLPEFKERIPRKRNVKPCSYFRGCYTAKQTHSFRYEAKKSDTRESFD